MVRHGKHFLPLHSTPDGLAKATQAGLHCSQGQGLAGQTHGTGDLFHRPALAVVVVCEHLLPRLQCAHYTPDQLQADPTITFLEEFQARILLATG